MKKIIVLLFVLILLFSMSTLAFAADDTSSETETVSDPAQDFMNSLNDGTIESAGNIVNESLDGLDDFTQPTGIISFLTQGLSWVPSEIWTVFTLGLVLSLIRVVTAFLWR